MKQEVKRAALHELIEFVTTSGSSTAAAAAGMNNNNKVKDKDNKDSSGNQDKDQGDKDVDGPPSLLSTTFESLFYQDMVNTV